jgi:hypothetical protein
MPLFFWDPHSETSPIQAISEVYEYTGLKKTEIKPKIWESSDMINESSARFQVKPLCGIGISKNLEMI